MVFTELYIYPLSVHTIMLFVFAVIFLIVRTKQTDTGFKQALCLAAIAYFCHGVENSVDIFFIKTKETLYNDYALECIVSIIQVLLLTCALLKLLDLKKFPIKKTIREFGLIFSLSLMLYLITLFFSYSVCVVKIITYSFIPSLIFLLCRYTYVFFKTWRASLKNLENYYSENECDRLIWVIISFIIILLAGLSALINALFPNPAVLFYSTIFYFFGYLYLALRLIRYDFVNKISDELSKDDDNDKVLPQAAAAATRVIENNLHAFLNQKQFTKSGINIDDVAKMMGTNRNYLSKFINSTQNKSFSQWINTLRIEHSKTLMRENPKMPSNDVAAASGFSSRSHFAKQFFQDTGVSPAQWKQKL